MTLRLMEARIISTIKREKVTKIDLIILRNYKAVLYNKVISKLPLFQRRVNNCFIITKDKSKVKNNLRSSIRNYAKTIELNKLILIQPTFSLALMKLK